MFWLTVKGPVYWKHASFLMFGFLSLFSPFLFFPECTAQGLQKGYGAQTLPQGKGRRRSPGPEFLRVVHWAPPPRGQGPWTLSVETPGPDEL